MKKYVCRPLPLTNSIQMLKLEQRGRRREQQNKPSQTAPSPSSCAARQMFWAAMAPLTQKTHPLCALQSGCVLSYSYRAMDCFHSVVIIPRLRPLQFQGRPGSCPPGSVPRPGRSRRRGAAGRGHAPWHRSPAGWAGG